MKMDFPKNLLNGAFITRLHYLLGFSGYLKITITCDPQLFFCCCAAIVQKINPNWSALPSREDEPVKKNVFF